MRLMFVYRVTEDTGSSQDIAGYSRAAGALGHEVVVHGAPRPGSTIEYSLDADSVDAVVFVLEWCYITHAGGPLNLVRLVAGVPRHRRVVIDCDGMYNGVVTVEGDYNHLDDETSRRRIALCDGLTDKVVQPTLHPLRPAVGSFLFHAYDPAWELPLDGPRDFGMIYVGNNWFRWRALQGVLEAVAPIRRRVGRIGLIGYGWDPVASWVEPALRKAACHTDPAYLCRMGVEVLPSVPIPEVVPTMSRGTFNPILVRPLFRHLGLVTCRTFETLAAGTIPVFALEEEHVKEIYGERAVELALGPDPTGRVADVLDRPEHYAEIVVDTRRHLREAHSYQARLRQLVELVER